MNGIIEMRVKLTLICQSLPVLGMRVDTWKITSHVEFAQYGAVHPVVLFCCRPPRNP